MQITDVTTTIGNVFIKKPKVRGNATKLSQPWDRSTSAPRTTYLIYFDTNLGILAMTVGIGKGRNKVDLNVTRGVPTGGTDDRLVLSPTNHLTEIDVVHALSGFHDADGPAFMTIQDPSPTKQVEDED